MPIPIVPILEAISNLANTAWDIYRRTNQEQEVKGQAKQTQEALLKRVEKLEDSNLEQARLIGELSKDLEQFARAMQAAVQENQKREARLRRILYVALAVAAASLAISVVALVQ